jgi:hypothetical protein
MFTHKEELFSILALLIGNRVATRNLSERSNGQVAATCHQVNQPEGKQLRAAKAVRV